MRMAHSSNDGCGSQFEGSELSAVMQRAIQIAPGTAMTLLPDLLRAIRLHLNMEVGFLSEFKNHHRIFRYVSDDGEHQFIRPGDTQLLEDTYCLRVVKGLIPSIIPDAQQLEAVQDLRATSELNIGAHLSIPIYLDDGHLYGTLCCFSTQPDETLTQRDLDFMSVIGDLVGRIVQYETVHLQEIETKRDQINEVIRSGAMTSVWQPIVDLETDRVIGVEALARFRTTPYRSPDLWFRQAAEVDRFVDLERNALNEGLKILPALPAGIRIGCNMSGVAVLDSGVRDYLASQNLERIVLEITEHDVIEDYKQLTETLEPLREKGLMLAIDDFGAGYATFRDIVYLHPDIIKLDISLVRGLGSNKTAQSIIRAMIAFAEENRRSLVAEGVETEDELRALRSLGVQRAQGYLLHKPLDRSVLLEILEEY